MCRGVEGGVEERLKGDVILDLPLSSVTNSHNAIHSEVRVGRPAVERVECVVHHEHPQGRVAGDLSSVRHNAVDCVVAVHLVPQSVAEYTPSRVHAPRSWYTWSSNHQTQRYTGHSCGCASTTSCPARSSRWSHPRPQRSGWAWAGAAKSRRPSSCASTVGYAGGTACAARSVASGAVACRCGTSGA